MKKCIICDNPLTDKNASKEHIIPEAIGGNITSRELLCSICNKSLGSKVDYSLTDDPFILMLRHNLIESISMHRFALLDDRTGKRIVLKRNESLTFNPTKSYYHAIEPKPEIESFIENGYLNITGWRGSDIESIITLARREAKKHHVDFDEETFVERLKCSITTGKTKAILSGEFDFNALYPCFIKMAYEFLVFVFGDAVFREPNGDNMRRFLYLHAHGDDQYSNRYKDHAEVIKFTIIPSFDRKRKPTKHHLLGIAKSANGLFVIVNLFSIIKCTIQYSDDFNIFSEAEFSEAVNKNKRLQCTPEKNAVFISV